jgi:hypothetical protein
MVRLPSLDRDVDTPVHLPLMSRLGPHHATQRDRHDAPRHIPESEPRKRQERGREAGGPGEVQAGRQCAAEAEAERRARRG